MCLCNEEVSYANHNEGGLFLKSPTNSGKKSGLSGLQNSLSLSMGMKTSHLYAGTCSPFEINWIYLTMKRKLCLVSAQSRRQHTPGHMAVSVSSSGKQLLCIPDAFLHPIHIEYPEWHAAHEVASEQIMKTRQFLLNKAATEKALMLAFHLPFPGLGRVVQKGTGWHWQPIQRLA